MVKTHILGGVAVVLAFACVGQQVWIMLRPGMPPTQVAAHSIPPATYEVELLSRSLQRPMGGKSVGDRESFRLLGTGYGTTGFEASLWIDTSDVEFAGRAKDLREERAAEVTAFYAKQIAKLIPSAVIECAIDRPGIAESGSLHSTFLVRHPCGCIVVSGGYSYMFEAGSEPSIGNVMKVQIVSSNYCGDLRRELVIDKTLPPGNS